MNGTSVTRHPAKHSVGMAVVLALCLGVVTGSGRVALRARADDAACGQWDVSGGWGLIDADYSFTAAFTQDGTILRGEVTLPDGQWQSAAWSGPTMDLRGSVTGNLLDFTITVTRSTGATDFPRFTGAITRGTVDPTYGEIIDGTETLRGLTANWTGTGPATCAPSPTDTPGPTLPSGATPTPSPFAVGPTEDPEYALQAAFGGYFSGFQLMVDNVDNDEEAADNGYAFQEQFADLLDMADGSTSPYLATVNQLVWSLGYLSAADNVYGDALIPVLQDPDILGVVMKMAVHAATDPDPPSAQSWLTATQRLLALLATPATTAQPSQAPVP